MPPGDPAAPAEGGAADGSLADPIRPTASGRPRAVTLVGVGLLLMLVVAAATVLLPTLGLAPTEHGRSGLGAGEQALFGPRLATIDDALDRLVGHGSVLAQAGRDVLTRVRALDPDGVGAAIAQGGAASTAIASQSEDLVRRRAGLLIDIDPSHLAESERLRLASIDRALTAAAELPGSWSTVMGMVSGPVDLVRSLRAHDAQVAAATAAARGDDLPGALAALEDARRLLVPARAVRESAAKAGADVGTLDDLLVRLDTYDEALIRLYTLLGTSGETVTDEVRAAYAEVGAAQASLPRDDGALRAVVSDLAGRAITATLVDIETQRDLIAAAVAGRPDASGR